MNAIQVKNLKVKLGPSRKHELSFVVEQGTVCGFVGKNGAGKTLLLQALVRQHEKSSGVIELLGHSVDSNFEEIKKDIGVVWAQYYGPLDFTANHFRDMYQELFENWDDPYFYKLLEKFEIHATDKIKSYSAGMLVKLQIALALAHHPKLLILDEPTAHLDPFARDQLMQILADYMEDETNSILISSHNLSDLEKLADSILFIEAGELVFHENKDTMTGEYVIWRGPLPSMVKENAVIAIKRSALGRNYLLAKQLLPPSFFEAHQHEIQSPSIEEFLLFTTNFIEEVKS